MRPDRATKRNICFVTGTRAEFGLMHKTLRAIADHPRLCLQIVATGMHLDRTRGRSLREIEAAGFKVNQTVPWPVRSQSNPTQVARATGRAMAELAESFAALKSDIILVVGDRVEAFAAASAGHISNRVVAHLHGGDRALGQIDDALRHAITKLAQLHFPATQQSAGRIIKLGEDRWRVHCVGSPGIDGIRDDADPTRHDGEYALVILHPVDADERLEERRANQLLNAIDRSNLNRTVIVYPNNDPGSRGIIRAWRRAERSDRVTAFRNLDRSKYLALLRDCTVLVGNSSSGIIEAASFSVPVVDVGPRQQGRERSGNVVNVRYSAPAIANAVAAAIRRGSSRHIRNIYGGNGTSRRIANVLATINVNDRLTRKLITY